MRKQVKKTLVAGSALGIVASSMIQPMIGHAEGEPVVTAPEPETAPVEETTTDPTPVEEPTEPSPAEPAEPVTTEPEPAPETPVEPPAEPSEPAEPVEATPTEPTDPAEPPVESEPAPEEGAETVQEANFKKFDEKAIPAILSALKEDLGIQNPEMKDFTDENLSSITVVDGTNLGITSLKGFEKLTNVVELYLSRNKIEDVTPLSNLLNLKELWLYDNELKTITPLKELKDFWYLNVGMNYLDKESIDVALNLDKWGNIVGNMKWGSQVELPVMKNAEGDSIVEMSQLFYNVANKGRAMYESEWNRFIEKHNLTFEFLEMNGENGSNFYDFIYSEEDGSFILKTKDYSPDSIYIVNVMSDKLGEKLYPIMPVDKKNSELKSPIKTILNGVEKSNIMVNTSNEVFFNPKVNGDMSNILGSNYLLKGINGVKQMIPTETSVFILDLDNNLFALDIPLFNQSFGNIYFGYNRQRALETQSVAKLAENVEAISLGNWVSEDSDFASISGQKALTMISEDGSIRVRPLNTYNWSNQDFSRYAIQQQKVKSEILFNKAFTADALDEGVSHETSIILLEGSDGHVYLFNSNREEQEEKTKNIYADTQLKKTTLLNGMVKKLWNNNLVEMTDGKVKKISFEKGDVVFSETNLSKIKKVVETEFDGNYILTDDGEIFKEESDSTSGVYSYEKLNLSNVKSFDIFDYSRMVFVTNDGELYHLLNPKDVNDKLLIDTEVNYVRTFSPLKVHYMKNDGSFMELSKYTATNSPLPYQLNSVNKTRINNLYTLSSTYLERFGVDWVETTDPDPIVNPPIEPPVVTPPTEPEPPVVTPPPTTPVDPTPTPPVVEPEPEPETPVVPTPEEPLEPPVVTPEPDVPPTPTIPEEPVISTPEPEEPVDETPIDETPVEPVVEVPTEPILDDETDTDVVTNPVIEEPSTETAKEEHPIDVTYKNPIVKEEKPVVADDDSESDTAEEVDSLPQTGDPVNPVSTGVGILSILAGIFLFKKRKERK